MPYIVPERRVLYDPHIAEIFKNVVTPGDLNYVITRLCHEYLKLNGTRYDTLNTIIGVLSCADKEFYRRMTVPYEDTKIKINGDVQ
jgi:cystathionine beta-lyase family protein involved in aluminum resistance